MVERAVRRRHAALSELDFGQTLDTRRLGGMVLVLLAAVAVPTGVAALFPDTAGLWARRMFLASREPWPQNTYLRIVDERDGRIQVPRGEPFVLRAAARDGSQTPERIMLTIRGADKTSVLMKQFGPNDFRHDFAVVDQPLQIELDGGDDSYGPVLIEPVDRPRIVGLRLEDRHPRQKAAETFNFGAGDADLSFLVKTDLRLSVTANVPLSDLRLKPHSDLPQPSHMRRLSDSQYEIAWQHAGPAKFDLELVARESGLVSIPVPVAVGLKVDAPPRVTMAFSGVRQRVTPSAKIPLTVDARDDYGLAAVGLAVKDETPDPADPAKLVARSATQKLFPTEKAEQPKPDALPLEQQLKPTVDVAAEKLAPGSFLSLTAEATDDCYTGAQTAHARTIVFSIVAPEELFREILLRQQNERIKFRKQVEEAEKLAGLLTSAEGLKNADAKGLAEITRRHRALQLETRRIAASLGQSLTEIKLNGLGSPESHALMERNVLAPLTGLEDELIGPQTTALDGLAPSADGAVDAAKLKGVAERQDQITARMKTIFNQMSQWDSFVDVLNQLDQIIKLETGVKDGSQKLEKKDTDGLFDN